MRKRSFLIGTLSDIGYVKNTNQDRILIKIGEEKFGDFGLFVVADGMGGLAAGDKASEIVITEFINWWNIKLSSIFRESEEIDINTINKELDDLIFDINMKVIEFGRSIDSRIGTTLSMLLLYRNKYLIKHIGDSRIYKINNDMSRLTEDHSWVAEQIRQGKMNKQEAINHPRSHVLIQCIGVKKAINLYEKNGEASEEDVFLLCSDGFYNLLQKNEILNAIGEYEKNDEDIQETVEKLMKKVKERGALDNASAILIYQNFNREKKGILQKIRELMG